LLLRQKTWLSLVEKVRASEEIKSRGYGWWKKAKESEKRGWVTTGGGGRRSKTGKEKTENLGLLEEKTTKQITGESHG